MILVSEANVRVSYLLGLKYQETKESDPRKLDSMLPNRQWQKYRCAKAQTQMTQRSQHPTTA